MNVSGDALSSAFARSAWSPVTPFAAAAFAAVVLQAHPQVASMQMEHRMSIAAIMIKWPRIIADRPEPGSTFFFLFPKSGGRCLR